MPTEPQRLYSEDSEDAPLPNHPSSTPTVTCPVPHPCRNPRYDPFLFPVENPPEWVSPELTTTSGGCREDVIGDIETDVDPEARRQQGGRPQTDFPVGSRDEGVVTRVMGEGP